MTYIGSPQGAGFSKIDSQRFSGNGSATAFTMRHAVGQTEHVAVYVNNVRQDPFSAYAVSGNTLTFTEAPSNASNNIYVVFLGGAINTVDLPPDSVLSLRDGLKQAPSLFRHDDIQTGVYFPAANSIHMVQNNKTMFAANATNIALHVAGTKILDANSSGINVIGSIKDDGTTITGTITANTQLGSGVITQHAIASGNVVTSTIGTGAVTDAKILNSTISSAKLASGIINANTLIGSGVITQNNIANANVVTSKINNAAVTGAKLATGAVSANTKLANDVVTRHAIGPASIGATEISVGDLAAGNAVFSHNLTTYAKAQRGRVDSVTVGAANVTIDFANTNIFNLTLGTNSNLNRPSNIAVGQAGTIFITQDGTGSRTLSFSSVFDFIGGTAPTLTTTASGVDRLDYIVYSTSRIQVVATLAYS